LIKDTVITFATRIGLLVLSSVVAIVTARLLGAAGRGVYYLLITYLGALILLGSLGLEVSNVYFGAKNVDDRPSIFWNSVISGAALGSLLIVAGWGLYVISPKAFREVDPRLLTLALMALPFMMVSRFLVGLVLGLQQIIAYNVLNTLERALVVVLFLSFLMRWPQVRVAIAAYVSVQIVLAVITFSCLTKIGLAGSRISPKWSLMRDAVPFGIKSQAGNVLQFLNYRLAAFVINYFINPAQVGIYSIALVLGESLWHLSNSVATVILPRISASPSLERSAMLASRSTRASLVFTALLAVCIMFVSPWLISVLFGSDFGPAAQALAILLPGIVVFSTANVLASYIAGSGYPQYNTLVGGAALGVTVIGNLSFVPRWGINGAALASTLSYVATTLGSLYFYRRLSGRSVRTTLIPTRQDLSDLKQYVGALYTQVVRRSS
jgi:O-antigen/teichoic acid export membrane protein